MAEVGWYGKKVLSVLLQIFCFYLSHAQSLGFESLLSIVLILGPSKKMLHQFFSLEAATILKILIFIHTFVFGHSGENIAKKAKIVLKEFAQNLQKIRVICFLHFCAFLVLLHMYFMH